MIIWAYQNTYTKQEKNANRIRNAFSFNKMKYTLYTSKGTFFSAYRAI